VGEQQRKMDALDLVTRRFLLFESHPGMQGGEAGSLQTDTFVLTEFNTVNNALDTALDDLSKLDCAHLKCFDDTVAWAKKCKVLVNVSPCPCPSLWSSSSLAALRCLAR
jgi:hypothetical protein